MARHLADARPLRQAGFLYRRIRQSPPLLIALAIHGAVILILMSITIQSDMAEVVLTVDVSKVLAQKVERPPEEIIKPPETPENIVVQNPTIDFSTQTENPFDNQNIVAPNVIQGQGRGIVAPFRPGGGGKGMSFGKQVMKYRRGGLDVVFVVDTTETLRKFIDQFKQQINNMIKILDTLVGARCRIGIVCYRDKAGTMKINTVSPVAEFYHTKSVPLTNDRDQIRAFVQAMGVGPGPKTEAEAKDYESGKGIPANEDVYEGLRLAVEMPWSQTAKRVVILMGDALPHVEDMNKLGGTIAKLRSGGNAALHCIYSEPPIETGGLYGAAKERAIEDQKKEIERVYNTFRELAKRGGGEAVSIEQAKQVVQQLLVFALGPTFRKNVDEIYTELGIGKEEQDKAAAEKGDKKEEGKE